MPAWDADTNGAQGQRDDASRSIKTLFVVLIMFRFDRPHRFADYPLAERERNYLSISTVTEIS